MSSLTHRCSTDNRGNQPIDGAAIPSDCRPHGPFVVLCMSMKVKVEWPRACIPGDRRARQRGLSRVRSLLAHPCRRFVTGMGRIAEGTGNMDGWQNEMPRIPKPAAYSRSDTEAQKRKREERLRVADPRWRTKGQLEKNRRRSS